MEDKQSLCYSCKWRPDAETKLHNTENGGFKYVKAKDKLFICLITREYRYPMGEFKCKYYKKSC